MIPLFFADDSEDIFASGTCNSYIQNLLACPDLLRKQTLSLSSMKDFIVFMVRSRWILTKCVPSSLLTNIEFAIHNFIQFTLLFTLSSTFTFILPFL